MAIRYKVDIMAELKKRPAYALSGFSIRLSKKPP